MLTGLDILIARMKTNPEEFLVDRFLLEGELLGGKWNDLINYAGRVANEEERQALEDAIKEMHRDDFNEKVMKRLAGEETPVVAEKDLGLRASGRKAAQAMTHQQMMQNSMAQNVVLQGGMYDPNTHGYLTTTGFQAAEVKGEGQPVGYSGMGQGFWSGITKSFGGR